MAPKAEKKPIAQRDDEAPPPIWVPSDYSIHPTYSNVRLSYAVICRERSKRIKREYDRQFLHELHRQEAMQSCAYDAMRFHRHFAITTLWPPLHTRKEIDYVIGNMFRLTKKQEKRLNDLLTLPQF